MNITYLKTFLMVVELRNLNKAAQRLHVTQSTVSARLDALEDHLGQQLLMRSRKGTELTKAGFALLRHAENIVHTWERGQRAITLPTGYSASVSISCEADLWLGLVETWVEELGEQQPQLAIEIWPGFRAEIEGWLQSGLIDMAISNDPFVGDGIANKLFQQHQLLHVQSSHMQQQSTYLIIDHGPAFRRQFSHHQANAKYTFGQGSNSWALNKILRGGYHGYLPNYLVQPYLANEQLSVVADSPTFPISSYLSWRLNAEEQLPWLQAI